MLKHNILRSFCSETVKIVRTIVNNAVSFRIHGTNPEVSRSTGVCIEVLFLRSQLHT